MCATHGPNLVISDIAILAPEAIETTQEIVGSGAHLLLYADRIEPQFLALLLRAGVRGMVSRSASPSHMAASVTTVMSGRLGLDPDVQAAVTQALLDGASEGPRLTKREREVLQLVEAGWNTAQIAAQLHLSDTTVKTHLRRVAGKLGTRGRAASVASAVRQNLL